MSNKSIATGRQSRRGIRRGSCRASPPPIFALTPLLWLQCAGFVVALLQFRLDAESRAELPSRGLPEQAELHRSAIGSRRRRGGGDMILPGPAAAETLTVVSPRAWARSSSSIGCVTLSTRGL